MHYIAINATTKIIFSINYIPIFRNLFFLGLSVKKAIEKLKKQKAI
jgi:hypothetical protein